MENFTENWIAMIFTLNKTVMDDFKYCRLLKNSNILIQSSAFLTTNYFMYRIWQIFEAGGRVAHPSCFERP